MRAIGPILLAVLAAGCATPPASRPPAAPEVSPKAAPAVPPALVRPPALKRFVQTSSTTASPVARGELPWWHDLEPGVYSQNGARVVFAVGRSSDHHHVAEGYLTAKVVARLGVRKAAEPVAFSGTMPEPELSDLFITREQRFFALYRMPLPEGAELPRPARPLEIPAALDVPGRRRVGRHIFEGPRHLYLECEVEGPVANPDWGRTRATAMWTP